MDYTPQLGDAVELVLTPGYTAPLGNAVELTLSSGGIELSVISGVGFLDSILPTVSGWHVLSDEAKLTSAFNPFITMPETLFDTFSLDPTELTQVILSNLLTSLILPQEAIAFYTPSGIIQLLSDPFMLTESPFADVTLTELLFPITLTETNQTQVTLTEVTESVTITEVL